MRILWSSNAPWAPTGYGKQTKYIIRGMRDLGYKVACLCFWGLEGGDTEWEGIPMFPRQLDGYGNDAMPMRIRQFKADMLFTFIDLWVMNHNLGRHGAKWCAYAPIDHDPIPPPVAERFSHVHKLVMYSKFAERLAREYNEGRYADKVVYIPHGVDTDIFRPCIPEEKVKFRRKYYPDWPEDAFIVGMVAANKGYPSRKSFPEAFEAFSMLAAEHPEARLYAHSYPGIEFGGPNLNEMALHLGLKGKARFVNPDVFMAGTVTDEVLREIYCTFDVFLNPAMGEGWGVPIVEAQACGVPAITTDFSAMTEVTGVGWRVPPLRLIPTLIWGKQAQADVQGVFHALIEARRTLPSEHMSIMAREFAMQYTWPKVIEEGWRPFLKSLDAGQSELAKELR